MKLFNLLFCFVHVKNTGGESIWGKPFKDEVHSRLRFVRRGLVAMANSGKDDNGSQFFFTLAPTRELQNKHTIFGKVVGDTIFNMLRLSEGHLEDGDRPKYPHKIIRTRVLINPFNDITPRETIQQEVTKSKKSKPESKMKATKDFKLLSFGEEAEDDEESLNVAESSRKKGKSAHDLADDPNLLSNSDKNQLGVNDDDDSEDDEERKRLELNSVKEKLLKRKAEKEMLDIRTKLKKTDVVEEFIKEEEKGNKDDELDFEYECPIQKEKQRRKDEIQKEYKALAKELKPKKHKEKKDEEPEEEKISEAEKNNEMLLNYHKEQKKYKEKTKGNVPKKKASREDATLAMLAKFKQKLTKISEADDEAKVETVARNDQDKEDNDEDDVSGDSWMKNTLRFENNDPVLARDASTKVEN